MQSKNPVNKMRHLRSNVITILANHDLANEID